MSVVQVEVQLSTDELLKAVGQLNQSDLEQLVFQIIALRARRQAPNLPPGHAGYTIGNRFKSFGVEQYFYAGYLRYRAKRMSITTAKLTSATWYSSVRISEN